ncbi:MAG: UTP--glucose-1-phosphate uridylyltransferase GalU [Acidimicrobiia bacterium]
MGHIKTAVFPVAGFGTRFLPATKAMPKVLLPIVDRPLIQFAVDEALASGIESFVFVTGRGHYAVEDYFDMSYELETNLISRGQDELAASLKGLRPGPGQIAYVRQTEPLGLGHAVWCARNLIGDEPFAVLLADELIVGERPNLARMIDIHGTHGGNVVLVNPVDHDTTDQYGIITADHEHEDIVHVSDVVEKPKPEVAASNLALVGRYVLEPSVMDILGRTNTGAGNEIQLTDAIRESIKTTKLHATRVIGDRYDCGSKTGFLEATVRLSLERPELADTVRALAKEIGAGD